MEPVSVLTRLEYVPVGRFSVDDCSPGVADDVPDERGLDPVEKKKKKKKNSSLHANSWQTEVHSTTSGYFWYVTRKARAIPVAWNVITVPWPPLPVIFTACHLDCLQY